MKAYSQFVRHFSNKRNVRRFQFRPIVTGATFFALLFFVPLLANSAPSVVISNDTAIVGSDTTYDAQDIIVQSCTLTVSGAHSFRSLQVLGGAVLTQPATTSSEINSLQLTVTSNLVLDATSRIDVSGRGYLPGYTQGNVTVVPTYL